MSDIAAIDWVHLSKLQLLGRPPQPGGEDALRCGRVRRAMLAMQRASWEQGVAAQACLEDGDWDLAILLAREAALRQDESGRLAQLHADPGITDAGAAGEAVVFAGLATGEPRLRRAAERMLGYFRERAPRSAERVLFHQVPNPDGELWSDSAFMAPPFLALVGEHEDALVQLHGLRARLHLPDRRLYAHRWNESRRELVRAAAWGVGNGWVAAGMVRVHAFLPASMQAEKDRLAAWVRELLDACFEHQRADGLFHDVVDDPSTFVETNLAQMLAWTIYRGVAAGWLDRALVARAEGMRAAAVRKVDRDGFVQDVCGAPFFDRPGVAAEGQAFFLMMEAARRVLGASA